MEPATRGTLETIAGQLAAIVGVVHIGLGAYFAVGGAGGAAGDPRGVLWTIAGAVLVGGVAVAAVGWRRRRLYALGVVVTVLLVSAHFLWPVVAGSSFYLGPTPVTSPANLPGYVHELVRESEPVAKLAVATELALLVLLLVLLRDENPR